MYEFMNVANVYPAQKTNKSYRAIKHGFVQTIIHLAILVIAIIVMTVYYSQLTETKRESLHVGRTQNDWIPYETYHDLWQKLKYESILSCDCSRAQINWQAITDSVDVNDDYVCSAVYTAYNSCYFDAICLNGDVGKILFYYLATLCEEAKYVYPYGKPPYSLTSGKVYTIDELYSIADELARDWQFEISNPIKTTFIMTYPLMNTETAFFYDWAISTAFEDLENATYWTDVWGLQNSSFGMASAFGDVDYEVLSYETIAQAIEGAFIDYISINYRYSNYSDATDWVSWGYYEKCGPYQCVWFTTQKKTFIEMIVIMFGLLGGIHAALFVVVGIGHTIYRKAFRVKFDHDEPESGKEETDKIQLTAHQELESITKL